MKISLFAPMLFIFQVGSSSSVSELRRATERDLATCDPECAGAFQECRIDEGGIDRCLCQIGSRPNATLLAGGRPLKCEDVDECIENMPCVENAVCSDHDPPELYKCACSRGFAPINPPEDGDYPGMATFEWRPTACVNIDECLDDDANTCDLGTTNCVNTKGSYTCVTKNLEPVEVNDVELKCSLANTTGFCNGDYQFCGVDDNGDIGCICEKGFIQLRANSTCKNFNECASVDTNNCDFDNGGYCVDIPGTFNCECSDGFSGHNSCTRNTAAPAAAPEVVESITEETPAPVVASSAATSGSGSNPAFVKNGCTKIQEIQGSGQFSLLIGGAMKICDATVTFVGSFGFFIQDNPTGDDTMSSGLYVSLGEDEMKCKPQTGPNAVLNAGDEPVECIPLVLVTPKIGDVLDISGTVNEFGGLTGIRQATWETANNAGRLPRTIAPVQEIVMPVTSLSDLERYEGMLVRFVAASGYSLYIDGVENFPQQVTVCAPPNGDDRIFKNQSREDTAGQRGMIFQRDSIPTHCVEIRNALESNPFMSHKIGGVIEITTATSPPLRAGNKMTVMQGVLFDVFAVQGSFSPEGSDGNEGGVSTISTNESARKLETQSDADDFSILLADIDEENILEHKMFDYETCSAAAERNGGVCQGNPLGRHGGSAGDTGSGTALYMLAPVDDTNVGWSDDNPRFTSPGLTDDGADYTLIANLNMRAFSHRGSDPRLALGVIIEEMPVPQGGKLREALTQIGADIVVVQDLGNTGAMLDNLNDQTRKLEVTNLRRPQKPMRPRFASVLQMLGSRKPPGGKPNIARKLETTKRLSSSIDIFFDTQEYALMSASPMTDLAYSLCHDSSNDGFEDCVSTAMQDFRRAFGSADIPFAATFQVKENREKIFTVVTADFSRVSTLKRAEKAGVNQQIDVFIDYFVVWMRRLASDGVVVRMPGSPGDPPVGPNIVFSGDLGPFFSQAVEFNPLLNMRGQYYTRDGPDGILWGSTEAILPQEQGQGRAQGGTTEIWHINADEPGSFGYDFQRQRPDGVFTGEPMRFSDHDPILYGRRFDNVDVIQCNDNSGCMPGRIQAGGRAPPGNTCKLFPDSVNNGGICGFCTSPYECDDLTHGCALQNVNGVYTRGECGMCEKDFQCRENQFCNNKGECEIEAPLEPGDIAFSCIQNRGDNSNTNDKFGFSILAMVDLPPRTEIYLSDIGRSKDGSQFDARSNEFELKYTLENNGIDMGFQKQFFAEDPETDGLQYTIGSSNSWNFNGGSGDSLFVYTKSEFGSRTQLIGALDFTRDNWETDENDSDDSVKSYLPDARWLNPLYAPETQPNNSKQAKEVRFDFNAHTAGITITKEELWAMMGSRSNWDRAGLSRDDGDCKEGKTADLTLV